MHIFLLDIPGLKFAALIPKVEYVTVCLLGENITQELIETFMNAPEVKSCFPPGTDLGFLGGRGCNIAGSACHCAPRLNMGTAVNPYGDRVVLVGDSAVSRLYKDGIGAAYNTAKACAVTSVFLGISRQDFEHYYWPICRQISVDNNIGKVIFFITLFYQKFQALRRGMVRMVTQETQMPASKRVMSRALWDTFTGSASYREIFFRAIHPTFILRLATATMQALFRGSSKK
ncbi:MAG: hypothetical protein HQL50_12495 [Magnetococcales bacterium]|nr:hypothetical protein [Magnetococcales bacterium]